MSASPGDLTILILTFNERENIARILQALTWAQRVLVVDSHSTDGTGEIVGSFPNARIIQNEFTTHATQWNIGLSHITSPWALTLDADYVLPVNAETQITDAMDRNFWGYRAGFSYWVAGKPIRGSVLPPRVVLFRVSGSQYVDDGHTQRLLESGSVGQLGCTIAHDDRKPLNRWVHSQINYAQLEATKLSDKAIGSISVVDRLRKLIVFAPIIVGIHAYILRGGFMSGWRGLFYAMQRSFAELLLSLFLLQAMLQTKEK